LADTVYAAECECSSPPDDGREKQVVKANNAAYLRRSFGGTKDACRQLANPVWKNEEGLGNVLYEPNVFRGFRTNVEMVDGYFVPSYQDPLEQKRGSDTWHQLKNLASSSPDVALKRCYVYLTKRINDQMNELEQELASEGIRFQPPEKG
jgi:hypothetical protein